MAFVKKVLQTNNYENPQKVQPHLTILSEPSSIMIQACIVLTFNWYETQSDSQNNHLSDDKIETQSYKFETDCTNIDCFNSASSWQ